MDTKERERLELFLVGNPLVTSADGSINFEAFEEDLPGA